MQNVFMLLAGLAFFLFGMEKLGTLLYEFTGRTSGGKIEKYTGGDFTKVLTGFAVTTLFQSSSATTVILVSMTSVGMISVAQSLSFLIGANIGSITTAWIVAVKITEAGIYVFTVGVIGSLIFKNMKLKMFSSFLIGIGLIFFGLDAMSGALVFLKDSPDITGFISNFDASVSILSMLLLTLFGVFFTAIIQSSGATAAMVITTTSLGVFSLHSGAAIVLGSTLGTTVTALLASLKSSAEGRRTAFLQIFINFIEMSAGLLIFYPSIYLIMEFGKFTGNSNMGFLIAVYMTFLKILLAVMIFPARKFLILVSEKLIKKQFKLLRKAVPVPVLTPEDKPEIIREKLSETMDFYMIYLSSMLAYSYIVTKKPGKTALFKKIERYEKVLDEAHVRVLKEISVCRNRNIKILWLFLKISDEAESMGDHVRELAKYGIRLGNNKNKLSEKESKLLRDSHAKVFAQFRKVCIEKDYRRELLEKSGQIERYLRNKKREFYLTLCSEYEKDHNKRLLIADILSEYSKFNHSIKRILQVSLDYVEKRDIYLWED